VSFKKTFAPSTRPMYRGARRWLPARRKRRSTNVSQHLWGICEHLWGRVRKSLVRQSKKSEKKWAFVRQPPDSQIEKVRLTNQRLTRVLKSLTRGLQWWPYIQLSWPTPLEMTATTVRATVDAGEEEDGGGGLGGAACRPEPGSRESIKPRASCVRSATASQGFEQSSGRLTCGDLVAREPPSERERVSKPASARASERAREWARLSSTGEVVWERDTVAASGGSGPSAGR